MIDVYELCTNDKFLMVVLYLTPNVKNISNAKIFLISESGKDRIGRGMGKR